MSVFTARLRKGFREAVRKEAGIRKARARIQKLIGVDPEVLRKPSAYEIVWQAFEVSTPAADEIAALAGRVLPAIPAIGRPGTRPKSKR